VPLELFAGNRVSDYPSAVRWYERLLGREPTFCRRDTEAVWELAEHRWLFIVESPNAGGAVHTILVEDLDALVDDIGSRDLEPDERVTYKAGARKAIYLDPDGNEIGFGEAPGEPRQ
jgi:hypothetical protein